MGNPDVGGGGSNICCFYFFWITFEFVLRTSQKWLSPFTEQPAVLNSYKVAVYPLCLTWCIYDTVSYDDILLQLYDNRRIIITLYIYIYIYIYIFIYLSLYIVYILHLGHLVNTFIQNDFQWFIPRFTSVNACKTSSSGAVRVSCLAQGNLDPQVGAAVDPTSNLPVMSTHYTTWAEPHWVKSCRARLIEW